MSDEKMEEKLVVEYLTEVEDESSRRAFRSFVLEELKEENPLWYDLMERVVVNNEPVKEVAADHYLSVLSVKVKISRARHWLYDNYYKYYREL